MGVHKKYYNATPGAHILSAPELSYVTILHVEREGAMHRVINVPPTTGQRACQYLAPSGQLIFDADNPFGGIPDPSSSTDLPGEKIYVLWKD